VLAALTPDVDLVYGRPTSDEHNWWRNASSRIVKAAISVWSGRGRIVRDASAFRAFRTSLREGFTGVNDPNLAIDALLSVVTSRYITCNVPMDQRRTGSSNYTFLALVRHSRELANGYRRSSPVSADRFGGSGARPAYTVRRSVGVDLGSAGQ
jgi:undecaprenyl-phosphate 4-deoxy-4-formamido-L-arabinose transferase